MNSALNMSTCETTPCHIWMHEVTTAAIAKGADAADAQDETIRAKMLLWFQSGEPVWMAADGLAFISKQGAKGRRADKEANALRGMVRAAIKGGV